MEAPRPCLPGLLLALLPCCCLLPRAAPQSSQPAADEAQLLLQIKSAWGNPPVLARWKNASSPGAPCTWTFVGCNTAGRVVRINYYFLV